MGKTSKDELAVEVRTASQGSFIPFTPVPDAWAGKRVRLVVMTEAEAQLYRPATVPPFALAPDAE